MSEDLYTKGYPHVPFPRGPLAVSAADLCTGGKDDVLVRLFYPTSAGKREEISSNPEKWTKWYLGDEHNHGFVKFITSSAAYSRFILPALKPFLYLYGYYLTKNIKVPVGWCLDLLPKVESVGGFGGWPVVVASHGMATHRSSLSTLSTDLASHGFVVAALEHREGSASASFYLDPKTKRKKWIEYTAFQHGQLDIRVEDVFSAFAVLERLNEGNVENLLEEESPFKLSSFKGGLDLENVAVMGQSYGGVSVLKVLADPRNCFRCGVLLDPWMFPVRKTVGELGQAIRHPLLSISTQEFNKGPNRKALLALKEAHTIDGSAFLNMAGTCHHHSNDSPWVSGRFGWWVTGGDSSHHPQTIHKFQCSHILNFLVKHMDLENKDQGNVQTLIRECCQIINENTHVTMTS